MSLGGRPSAAATLASPAAAAVALKRSACGSTIALTDAVLQLVACADGVAEHRCDTGARVVGALAAQYGCEHQLAADSRVVVSSHVGQMLAQQTHGVHQQSIGERVAGARHQTFYGRGERVQAGARQELARR